MGGWKVGGGYGLVSIKAPGILFFTHNAQSSTAQHSLGNPVYVPSIFLQFPDNRPSVELWKHGQQLLHVRWINSRSMSRSTILRARRSRSARCEKPPNDKQADDEKDEDLRKGYRLRFRHRVHAM